MTSRRGDRARGVAGVDVAVVGAGVFGASAALECAARGYRVALIDPGPLPHPLAASTDISKVVRLEYGADEGYTALAERARAGWLRWNEELGQPLYRETGVAMLTGLTGAPMSPGGFEHDSFAVLERRGHRPERLTERDIARRFPAFAPGAFTDGFYHALGGYADSGRTITALIARAKGRGIALYEGRTVGSLLGDDDRVIGVGVQGAAGAAEAIAADAVVVAAGAWTPALVPELAPMMHATGHPVYHLAPRDPAVFSPPRLPVFTADIGRTGWYGFPLHPREGVVKLGNHGVGVRLDPARDPRVVTTGDVAALRGFLAAVIPALADAPVVATRRCLYCDTLDGHFVIARHPARRGLVVAAGGSGHGFKFAPVLGALIADAIEGRDDPALARFGWRALAADTTGEEAARHRG